MAHNDSPDFVGYIKVSDEDAALMADTFPGTVYFDWEHDGYTWGTLYPPIEVEDGESVLERVIRYAGRSYQFYWKVEIDPE